MSNSNSMAIDVNEANFQSLIVEKSFEVPVVVDFWAAWCGPCRMLGPVLEKLEKDYAGAFILAKVDTEANQKLAAAFRIQSIPDVRIVKEGKVVDQFMGALPEKEIRKVLDKHIQKTVTEDSWEFLAVTKPMELLEKIQSTPYREQPENREFLLWTAYQSVLKNRGTAEEAKAIVTEIEEENASYNNQRRVTLALLEKDFEAIYDLADLFTEKKEAVMEKFLAKVESSTSENRGSAKDGLLACFYVLPPDDELVGEYRRKLSRLLF